LPAPAKRIIASATSVHYSIVSLWEIAIKAAKGQIGIDLDLLIESLDQAEIQELPVKREHVQMRP
jgi:PIN domain nuclease of toxin-antitoxin system